MPEHAESTDNRAYYDAFAERYDRDRDHGYHKLIDDQAAAIVAPSGGPALSFPSGITLYTISNATISEGHFLPLGIDPPSPKR